MHFLVFIPGLASRVERLADVGLPDLIEGALPIRVGIGPDGQPGTVYGWRSNNGQQMVAYDVDRQSWLPSVGCVAEPGAYWVGTWNDSPVTPEELLRPFPYRGTSIRLGDGRAWTFPRAASIPRDVVRGDGGEFLLVPQQRFAQFCVASDHWSQVLLSAKGALDVIVSEMAEFCELALRVNYRMTPEIPSMLRLWSSGDGGTLAEAMLGIVSPAGGAP